MDDKFKIVKAIKKTLDLSKLKTFPYIKLSVYQNSKYIFERVETIWGKEENAGSLLSPQCCQKAFSPRCQVIIDCKRFN